MYEKISYCRLKQVLDTICEYALNEIYFQTGALRHLPGAAPLRLHHRQRGLGLRLPHRPRVCPRTGDTRAQIRAGEIPGSGNNQ